MNSPVKAFVRDCCELRAGALADKSELFLEFRLWCDREGKTFVQDKARFGNSLLAATDHRVRAVRRKVDGCDKHLYEGIKIVRRVLGG
jgi:phage/plasmid-associated DNA primase